jgi:peptidoglycan-associated lipoprotein
MKVWNKILMIGLLAISIAACSTAKKEEETAAPTDQETATDSRQGAQDQGSISSSPFEDPNNPLSKHTVYFDFDSAEVKPGDREIVMAHAQYLASHPQTKVVLEGNTDERGSREYNIALGERRAKSVAQLMLLQGVSQSQIDVISFGEERPIALGHDESAWALNRRVDIIYPGM